MAHAQQLRKIGSTDCRLAKVGHGALAMGRTRRLKNN
jgi:hypothetical protein